MSEPGTLYIVATPIGNLKDITIRALEVLKQVDLIVCEEKRIGSTLLKKLSIPDKELTTINEHNQKENSHLITARLKEGANVALISDCGTPLFADPGSYLIHLADQAGIKIHPVPGASSLMAALSILDSNLNNFYFAGFLPREKEKRAEELRFLKNLNKNTILMDTPYRMTRLLEEVLKVFGSNSKLTLCTNLTMENEIIYRGTAAEILTLVSGQKAEFILVIHQK
mgnify:CR=1 FL=1